MRICMLPTWRISLSSWPGVPPGVAFPWSTSIQPTPHKPALAATSPTVPTALISRRSAVRCGYRGHADVVGARNVADRVQDEELAACPSLEAVKTLLDRRHQAWRQQNGYS